MPEPGTYFIRAYSGTSKAGKPFALVELVTVDDKGEGQAQTVWCEPPVADRARANFQVFDRVEARLETRLTHQGPRAELVEVEAA